MIGDFISTYGLTIMYTILTAIAGFIGTWIGKVYKRRCDDKTKRDVVSTCCRAVEQLYKDLHGKEKYDEATNAISEMLAEKGITITALEMRMLIEATCSEFAHSVKEEVANEQGQDVTAS